MIYEGWKTFFDKKYLGTLAPDASKQNLDSSKLNENRVTKSRKPEGYCE